MQKHTSQHNNIQMDSFGARLKAERKRLGLNQEDFAAVGGVKKLAQVTYEQDKRFPDAAYLMALSKIGLDIGFVLSGTLGASTLTVDESRLVAGFRQLDSRGQAGVVAMIDGMLAAEADGVSGASPNSRKKS